VEFLVVRWQNGGMDTWTVLSFLLMYSNLLGTKGYVVVVQDDSSKNLQIISVGL